MFVDMLQICFDTGQRRAEKIVVRDRRILLR